MAPNLYALLGLSPDAHPDVIKAAYRALAKQYHPDGAGAGDPLATEKFIELQQAYEVLGNSEARQKYNASLTNEDSEGIEVEPEASIDPDEVWRRRAQEHPEIDPIHTILYQYSPALANRFRLAVINDECTEDPAHYAADLEGQYFKKYFGDNPDVVAIARRLLAQGNRTAAKELNVAVKKIDSNDLPGLRDLVARFELNSGNEGNATGYTQSGEVSIEQWPTERRFGIPALVMALIVVAIAILYFGTTNDSPDRSSATSERAELNSTNTPSTANNDDTEQVPNSTHSAKSISDRLPEAQILPNPGDAPILSKRDLTNGNLYPEITKTDVPYSEDTAIDIDTARIDYQDDTLNVTTIPKQYSDPSKRYVMFWSDRPLVDSLVDQGVSKDTAENFVSAIASEFPIGDIQLPTSMFVGLERQEDFSGQVSWYPFELTFKTGFNSVKVTTDDDGKVSVTTDDGKVKAPVSGGRRIALVIGNANYRQISWLSNPDEDAKLISASLAKLGFDVTLLMDASEAEMRSAINDFTQAIGASTEFALVYYSGHAVEISAQNYLLPIDIPSDSSQSKIESSSINLSLILSEMDRRQVPTKVLIVDACRDNPFRNTGTSRGLAAVVAPSGTFIAYATAPGTVAMDGSDSALASPYSRALAEALKVPAPTIEDTFKAVRTDVMKATQNEQIPWDGSSLVGEVSFTPVSAPTQVRDYREELKSRLPQQVSPSALDQGSAAPPLTRKPRARPKAESVAILKANDYDVCYQAISPERDAWDTRNFEQPWVFEARRRGLTVNACLARIGRPVVVPIPSSDQQG